MQESEPQPIGAFAIMSNSQNQVMSLLLLKSRSLLRISKLPSTALSSFSFLVR
jgi:hypothetical protein